MNGEHKLMPIHRSRKAVVYLRQSSEAQVRHHKESQRMQYALADAARRLGFSNVEVIDCDLGSSASLGAKKRSGFERLLALVALGEVGLVLSRELSRLARTDKDWCNLFELCQLFDTRIGDAETIYDVTSMDDQLVLGIKGTLSVVELKILQARMIQGMENKARRGQLYRMLPPGYVLDGAGQIVKDPNLRVQHAIGLVFERYNECWSVRLTFKSLWEEGVELPVNKPQGGRTAVVFRRPKLSFVGGVLRNPFYAGAYVYGRRPGELVVKEGVVRKRQGYVRAPEKARVFLREHHEGYISWEAFEENQRRMQRNHVRGQGDVAIGAIRAGRGLLQGLLRCQRCGRKLHVRYWGRKGTSARYLCSGSFQVGGRYCEGFGSTAVDRRFEEEILSVVSPLGVQASLRAAELSATRGAGALEAIAQHVTQLEYETARAREQYEAVDARNRLVAAELERRWNEKLEDLARARRALEEKGRSEAQLSKEERERLLEMGGRFREQWSDVSFPVEMKKKIIRSLVEEIVVAQEPPGTLRFYVHWKGGTHTTLEMAKVSPAEAVKTPDETVEIIRKMAERHGDGQIAAVLNRLGRRTGRGNRWDLYRVRAARHRYGIDGARKDNPDQSEVLSMAAAARHCGVSNTAISRLVDAGLLAKRQVVPGAPWEIQRADLMSDPVRRALERLKRTGKLVLEGASGGQGDLFKQTQGDNNAR